MMYINNYGIIRNNINCTVDVYNDNNDNLIIKNKYLEYYQVCTFIVCNTSKFP